MTAKVRTVGESLGELYRFWYMMLILLATARERLWDRSIRMRFETELAAAASSAAVEAATAAEAGTSTGGKAARVAPTSDASKGAYVSSGSATTPKVWSATSRAGEAAQTAVAAGKGCTSGAAAKAAPETTMKISVAVVKGMAMKNVGMAAVDQAVVEPIKTPSRPSPAEAKEGSDAKSETERNVRTSNAEPPGIKPRPYGDGITINELGIVFRNVNDIGVGGRDVNVVPLIGHVLLWGALQISRLLRLVAHVLDGVHDVGGLVGVGIAKFGGPRKILIHVGEDAGELAQSFDAGIPILLIDGIAQVFPLEIGILLEETLSFYDLGRISRGRENLCHKRIRIERDGSDEFL